MKAAVLVMRTAYGLTLAAALAAGPARADGALPACKPLRLVVPFPAGGPADLLARALGHAMQERHGMAVLVDNKPGANGNIGMDAVRRAAGDGCTLAVVPAGNLTINPTLMPALPYQVARDYRPVALLAGSPNVLAVHPAVKARSVAELVQLARRAGPPLGFASPGVGSGLHLAGVLFAQKAGVTLLHVPYKGTTQALNDVVGGQVPILFGTLPTLAPFLQSGALRALAVTQARRSPAAPQIPSLAEQGITGVEVSSWYALMAPAGTPAPVVDALSREVRAVLALPTVREALQHQGMEPADEADGAPRALDARIRAETAAWAALIRKHGIQAE
ncbi:LacI family transcriptional regulator [Cupriavidus sp. USMAA2-4]|uniref:tripartite tricarboxylate transporter substrate binding protein n=1 Tax=Cupriavidus sp. USMAA2-4 TaxID=876364 RepID=UPI0008A6AE18|nr:tripartite tricarboxylate transporter substrate binding protein [Cupriavidus sp. USMAA2-4]AOY95263.1 LacI family transcriptional regulator [Cupriavidus sp. USMAA2-4]